MSITDEMREYAQSWRETPNLMDDLDAGDVDGILADFEHIADRIDAEHDKTLNSVDAAYDSGYNAGYDKGFASADDWLAQHEDAMAEHGWMRSFKDADGKYIHVKDMMYGTCPSGKYVCGEVSAIGDGVFWLSNVQFPLKPDYMHHYHAPTVEGMLWELLGKIPPDMEDEEAVPIVKAYAEKLRLADGEEQ